MHEITLRRVPERTLVSISRHVAGTGVDRFFDEAFVRLTAADMSWPAMMPAYDALERWVAEHGRQPAGAVRQNLVADQRRAAPDALACLLAVPLR